MFLPPPILFSGLAVFASILLLMEIGRRYGDARLETFRKIPDLAAVAAEQSRAEALQREIWAHAVAGCKEINSPAVTTLVLSSLNLMIDISTTRNEGAQMHPPKIIYIM